MLGNDFDTSLANNCFYATYGLVDTWDSLIYDFKNITSTPGAINWWNALIYDPVHPLGDSTVAYEYCNGQNLFGQLVSLSSLDWGFWV
jgi:hypothetical protein